ncbi:MAG: ClbS/DfsB family four-helix bundle protein [Bacteroidia bacterium]
MPRPRNKEHLLKASKENFEKLFKYINSLSLKEQEKEFPKGSLNRNIRDLLAHLHHWHLMMLHWYEIGMSGKKPAMPAEGYKWKQIPELNVWINEKYCSISLEKSKELVHKSHVQVCQLILNHTEEELFIKKRYKWTGTTSLAAYLISSTSSHYDTVFKLLKKFRKDM